MREAGADRYILKFETSNPELYKQIKSDDLLEERVECLKMLNYLLDYFCIGSAILKKKNPKFAFSKFKRIVE